MQLFYFLFILSLSLSKFKKIADISQMDSTTKKAIINEMQNEAKILKYLNDSEYPYAPKILYSGYWCGTLFYLNATELIRGKMLDHLFIVAISQNLMY